MKNYEWVEIEKKPKHLKKDMLYIYRFEKTEKEHSRDWVSPEDYRLENYIGCREPTHVMRIHKLTNKNPK